MDRLIEQFRQSVEDGSEDFELEPLDSNYVIGLCKSSDLLPRRGLRRPNFLFKSVHFRLMWSN